MPPPVICHKKLKIVISVPSYMKLGLSDAWREVRNRVGFGLIILN